MELVQTFFPLRVEQSWIARYWLLILLLGAIIFIGVLWYKTKKDEEDGQEANRIRGS